MYKEIQTAVTEKRFDLSMCKFAHVASWKQFKKDDQEVILEHANKTGNIWLDEATFKNQKVKIPQKYQHLLGDAKGPKPKVTKSA